MKILIVQLIVFLSQNYCDYCDEEEDMGPCCKQVRYRRRIPCDTLFVLMDPCCPGCGKEIPKVDEGCEMPFDFPEPCKPSLSDRLPADPCDPSSKPHKLPEPFPDPPCCKKSTAVPVKNPEDSSSLEFPFGLEIRKRINCEKKKIKESSSTENSNCAIIIRVGKDYKMCRCCVAMKCQKGNCSLRCICYLSSKYRKSRKKTEQLVTHNRIVKKTNRKKCDEHLPKQGECEPKRHKSTNSCNASDQAIPTLESREVG